MVEVPAAEVGASRSTRRAAADSRPTGQWAGSLDAGSNVSPAPRSGSSRPSRTLAGLRLPSGASPPMILSMLSNRRATVVRALLVAVALVVWLAVGGVCRGHGPGQARTGPGERRRGCVPAVVRRVHAGRRGEPRVRGHADPTPALVVMGPDGGGDVTPEQAQAASRLATGVPRPRRPRGRRRDVGRLPRRRPPSSSRPRTDSRCSRSSRSTPTPRTSRSARTPSPRCS